MSDIILKFLDTYLIENIIPIIISILAVIYAHKRYRAVIPTIVFICDMDKNFKWYNKIRLTRGKANDPFTPFDYKAFKRKFGIYKPISYHIDLGKFDHFVESKIDIPLTNDLTTGKYKFVFYIDKPPKTLKVKFEIPCKKIKSYKLIKRSLFKFIFRRKGPN